MSARFSKGATLTWKMRGQAMLLALALGAGGTPAWADEPARAPEVSAGDSSPVAPVTAQDTAEVVTSGVPEITAIAPTWGPSGWVFSLALEGRNLNGMSEVRFYPATGIVVEDVPVVNSEGTIATVKVTILLHAPLGPRLVVVRTPAGQSSLTPTEANMFKVSFAHLH